MAMFILLQQSHFLHKIYFNALPFKHVVLGGNKKLWKKNIFKIKLSLPLDWHGIKKIYTVNHSHYHQLVPLTKRTVSATQNIPEVQSL